MKMDKLYVKFIVLVLTVVGCIQDVSTSTKTVLYKVDIVTNDAFGAGTDADVFINIFGSDGDTGVFQLTNSASSSNHFERGSTDTFEFVARYVGNAITKVSVKRNSKGLFDDWKLDKILVKGSSPLKFKFAFNEWIPADKWVESYGGKK